VVKEVDFFPRTLRSDTEFQTRKYNDQKKGLVNGPKGAKRSYEGK
jgi:hypothetical protein